MRALRLKTAIDKDRRNAERTSVILCGEGATNSPTHTHHRYVINFEEFRLRRENCGEGGLQADE